MPSKIEWTDETWNPVAGCTKVSPGCANCYAERMALRLARIDGSGYSGDGLPPFAGRIHWDRFEQPLYWGRPRMVFVCSMGDLFHDFVHADVIEELLDVMRSVSRHTFQVLTKRPERMAQLLSRMSIPRNVWVGTSVESQDYVSRIDALSQIDAVVRFVSCEPLLGPIDLSAWLKSLGWVIVGAESGPGARPMSLDWVRDIRNQCEDANVPLFVKQLRIDGKLTKDMEEFPVDLRIRQFPEVVA